MTVLKLICFLEDNLIKENALSSDFTVLITQKNGISTISFPSLSTGAYGYPIDAAARIALKSVIEYLKEHEEIRLVRFVLFGADAYRAYESALPTLLQSIYS